MRYAHVVNGIVENVSIWEEVPSEPLILCSDDVSPGWKYVNGNWFQPEPPLTGMTASDPEIMAALRAVKEKAAEIIGLTPEEKDLLFGPNGDPVP